MYLLFRFLIWFLLLHTISTLTLEQLSIGQWENASIWNPHKSPCITDVVEVNYNVSISGRARASEVILSSASILMIPSSSIEFPFSGDPFPDCSVSTPYPATLVQFVDYLSPPPLLNVPWSVDLLDVVIDSNGENLLITFGMYSLTIPLLFSLHLPLHLHLSMLLFFLFLSSFSLSSLFFIFSLSLSFLILFFSFLNI
jgi:hypothetical protein